MGNQQNTAGKPPQKHPEQGIYRIAATIGLPLLVSSAFFLYLFLTEKTQSPPPPPTTTPPPSPLSSHPAPENEENRGNWSIYRGTPALQGVAPVSLPDTLTLKWSFETKEPVYSSAVVHQNRVYVGCDDARLYCLDLVKGTKVWSYKIDDCIEAPPFVFQDTVFVGSLGGFFYAVSADKGELRWKFETMGEIYGSANLIPPIDGRPPAVVVGSYDYTIYCLSIADGTVLWKHELDNYANGTPAIDGDIILFGGCDGLIYSISLSTGKKEHILQVGTTPQHLSNSITLFKNHAYIGTHEGFFSCLDLAGIAGKGTKPPQIPPTPPEDDAPEAAPDALYPIIPALWTYDAKQRPFISSAAVTESQVIVGCQDKKLYCFAPETGETLWTFTARGMIDSSPVICGDRVIVGSDDGRLYMINSADGEEVWSYDTGSNIIASPAVVKGLVIIGTLDGWIHAFGP